MLTDYHPRVSPVAAPKARRSNTLPSSYVQLCCTGGLYANVAALGSAMEIPSGELAGIEDRITADGLQVDTTPVAYGCGESQDGKGDDW